MSLLAKLLHLVGGLLDCKSSRFGVRSPGSFAWRIPSSLFRLRCMFRGSKTPVPPRSTSAPVGVSVGYRTLFHLWYNHFVDLSEVPWDKVPLPDLHFLLRKFVLILTPYENQTCIARIPPVRLRGTDTGVECELSYLFLLKLVTMVILLTVCHLEAAWIKQHRCLPERFFADDLPHERPGENRKLTGPLR